MFGLAGGANGSLYVLTRRALGPAQNARTTHQLAADVELATPASERWCVNAEDFNESGRVYLELAEATPAEAARRMAILTKLAG